MLWLSALVASFAPVSVIPARHPFSFCLSSPHRIVALEDRPARSSLRTPQFTQAAARVHAAATTFGAVQEQAAREYTEMMLSNASIADSVTDLSQWQVPLFSGPPEQYDELLTAMNQLQRLVSELRASEAVPSLTNLFRLVTGLDAKIEAMVTEVRLLAASAGDSRHARVSTLRVEHRPRVQSALLIGQRSRWALLIVY